MSQKNNTGKKQFESYKRNHSKDYYRDNEESKVSRDKLYAKKVERQMQKAASITGDVSEEELEEYEALLFKEKKARGSAKTHSKRLKVLSEIDDF